jgi:hypothetical protein
MSYSQRYSFTHAREFEKYLYLASEQKAATNHKIHIRVWIIVWLKKLDYELQKNGTKGA